MSEKEFEDTLKLSKYILLVSGVNILKNNFGNKAVDYFINHCHYYFNLIILYAVLYGEAYGAIDAITSHKSFVQVSLLSPCITNSVLATIKSWCLYWNKETLLQVINKLKEMHLESNDNAVEESVRKVRKESINMLKFILLLVSSIYVIVFLAFCLVPIIITEYHYYKNGVIVLPYIYVVKYPFDVYETPFWPLVFIHQVSATAIVIFFVFGSDTLFFALCVYINMHFRLLGLRFENIISPCKNETRKALAKAVVRHQELIELVEQTEVLYSKSSLFNIVTSSILICLSAFNITAADEMSIMFAFVTFLLMSLSQISMVCYFADLLMKSSVEINSFIYNCPWYEADEASKRTILLIMMRSQKACRLTAWKFVVLNLGAFTTILSRSWSYFALLKTVYK